MGARIRERFPPTKNAVNSHAPRDRAKRSRQPVGENPRTESATAACGCRRVRAPAGLPYPWHGDRREAAPALAANAGSPPRAVGRTHLDLSAPLEDRSRASEPLPRGCKSPAQQSDKPAATGRCRRETGLGGHLRYFGDDREQVRGLGRLTSLCEGPSPGDPRKGTCGRSNAEMTRVRPNLGGCNVKRS
jgi:hypothetical protein